ncbi:unnamed protein product [Mycena citricolor]|uniref:Rhamnogalacturonase A/B/Epimerase-like pectate lyase domain-containing protein n=1 Tax=Mycena citricolor TaxID=2018698 RepID=A0AAD2K528_9AGAR|nr:unnamed protein product [Mycena citricolor]
MGDLVFNGGKYGMWVGNQQFTVRNVTFNGVQTAIFGAWNWGWTFQTVTISNCQVGFDLATGNGSGAQTVGAEAIIDAVAINTPIFLRTSTASHGAVIDAGSLVLNNIKLTNVPTAVGVVGGAVVLAGSAGSMTIDSWAQGNVYHGNGAGTFTQGSIPAPAKPAALLDSAGRVYGRGHPQYIGYALSQIVSVKDHGAKGDGVSDDTAALQSVFDTFAGCKIIFVDAGTYIVTSTLRIPAGSQVVGEGWSVIAGKGPAFADMNNPQVVVQVGAPGSSGIMEITDIIFSTVGPAPGAIVVEWNVHESTQGSVGMWDSHIRLGGAAGTNLELAQCSATGGSPNCYAAFLALHLTAGSSAYLEGTWAWLADHEMEGDGYSQLTLYSGRGVLSESAGPVWMIGAAAEHHTLYQFNLVGAKNHYMGLLQTETVCAHGERMMSCSDLSSPAVLPADPRRSWTVHAQQRVPRSVLLWDHLRLGSQRDRLLEHPCLWRRILQLLQQLLANVSDAVQLPEPSRQHRLGVVRQHLQPVDRRVDVTAQRERRGRDQPRCELERICRYGHVVEPVECVYLQLTNLTLLSLSFLSLITA